jgi:hypothetical protein
MVRSNKKLPVCVGTDCLKPSQELSVYLAEGGKLKVNTTDNQFCGNVQPAVESPTVGALTEIIGSPGVEATAKFLGNVPARSSRLPIEVTLRAPKSQYDAMKARIDAFNLTYIDLSKSTATKTPASLPSADTLQGITGVLDDEPNRAAPTMPMNSKLAFLLQQVITKNTSKPKSSSPPPVSTDDLPPSPKAVKQAQVTSEKLPPVKEKGSRKKKTKSIPSTASSSILSDLISNVHDIRDLWDIVAICHDREMSLGLSLHSDIGPSIELQSRPLTEALNVQAKVNEGGGDGDDGIPSSATEAYSLQRRYAAYMVNHMKGLQADGGSAKGADTGRHATTQLYTDYMTLFSAGVRCRRPIKLLLRDLDSHCYRR